MRYWSSNLTPPEPRLYSLLLRIYTFPAPPYLPDAWRFSGGWAAPSCPDTLYTDVCCVSAHDHPPTWISPVSNLAYQCSLSCPSSSLSVLPPSDPSLLPPRLPDSCRRCTLATSEIASNVTFSRLSAASCLQHGSRIESYIFDHLDKPGTIPYHMSFWRNTCRQALQSS